MREPVRDRDRLEHSEREAEADRCQRGSPLVLY